MTQIETYIGVNKDVKTYKITADDGKVLRRKSDGQMFGNEMVLGKTWYLNGEKLKEPHFEVPEDYEEVDAPEVEEIQEPTENAE